MSHRLPSLNGLRAFEASARHLSFKMAGHELGVTAGAVSQQVKALEATLAVKLFRRLPRGLLLSDAGTDYLPSLSKAFRIISTATEEIAPALSTRKLRIGVSRQLSDHLPPGWPRGIKELHPYVVRRRTVSDVELIRSGDLDALLIHSKVVGHGLSSERIAVINTVDPMIEIHYAAPIGLSGCRQSRALVSYVERVFADH